MGRRVSVDKPQTKAGSRGIEGHKDYSNRQSASDKPSGDTQDLLRTALVHKQWPPTAEHELRVAPTGSSFCPASASNSSYELDRQPTSRDVRSPSRSSQIDRVDNAKSLFSSTGRALKRHATKLSLASSISFEKDEEGKMVWKLTGLGASVANPEPAQSSSTQRDTLKRAISAPFGFKHVTHTYREQVRGLERASRNELISEFSAIRAGQRADPHLKGIKAESLLTKETPSSPAQKNSEHQAPVSSANIALPISTSCNQIQPHSTSSRTSSQFQCHRPVGNFSRPASRTSFSPIPPPKRISSLNAFVPVVGVSEDALDTNDLVHGPRKFLQRTSRPTMNPAALLVGFNLPDQERDIVAIGHAISTTDDSARHLKASPLPMLPLDLDDVPEDEEGFVHCESRTSPISCGNRSLPLRHVQSFPTSRRDAVRNDQLEPRSSNTLRYTASLDEGHAGPDLEDCPANWSISEPHTTRRNTKRFSIGLKPMCETQDWEQDVDYSYEHAAEAESDFDWDHQVANFPVGLQSSTFGTCDISKNTVRELQQLAGLGLHGRKHDSQESSVLSVASSIIDISRSTNSVGSLPELDYSVNSSQESMDWGVCHGRKRKSKPTQPSQPTSPAKSPKCRQGLGLPYSLFPSNTTPPRTP